MTADGFAEHDDDDFLGLTPEEEDTRTIAPDEPFRADMILVPVVCGVCKLRIYAQEKHVGLWTACPDCGRLNEIRPVDPLSLCVVTMSSAGTLELKSLADSAPTPSYRANVDYTKVVGSPDLDAEIIPFYGLDETSEDKLENLMDRLIEKKSAQYKTASEKKFEALTAEAAKRKEAQKASAESPEDRKKRLLAELEAQKGAQSKAVVPGAVKNRPLDENDPASQPATAPVTQPALKPAVKSPVQPTVTPAAEPAVQPPKKPPVQTVQPTAAAPTIQRALPARVKKELAKNAQEKTAAHDAVWRHFFRPFFDSRHFRRFGILLVSGFFAMLMFSTLYHYLIQVTEPGSGVGYSFFLFYGLYLTAFFPMAVWGVMLLLSGISIFEMTKEGFSEIRRWIPFRVEFAAQYLFWLVIISWIAPFPGALASVILSRLGVSYPLGPIELVQVPVLGTITFFLLAPILFLSIEANDKGLEIYHAAVWKSLVARFWLWLIYYAVTAVLLAVTGACWTGTFLFVNYSVERSYIVMGPLYVALGVLLTCVTTACVIVGFRLLGALAWSIHRAGNRDRFGVN